MQFSLIVLFLAVIFSLFFVTNENARKIITSNYITLIIIGLLFRIVATQSEMIYEIDVNTFKSWSKLVFEDGFSNFYQGDYFSDYPPGYMYILYILGAIQTLFDLDFHSYTTTFLIKLPAIIFDLLIGVFVYKIACKRMTPYFAWFISLGIMLNPAIIIDSSIWGQVDSIYTFFMIISVYFITEKKYHHGFLIYAVAILIKPQALIIAPIYIYAVYEILEADRFSIKSLNKILIYTISCSVLFLICILPFTNNFNFEPIFKQYQETLGSYPYASLNAYNLYALLGANWRDIYDNFLFLPYEIWGAIFINIIVILSLILLNRTRTKSNVFFVAGLLNTLTFMLSTKMHERYLYASIVFFLIAFIYKMDKKLLVLFFGFTFTFFINCKDVLVYFAHDHDLTYLHHLVLISAINLAFTVFMINIAFSSYEGEKTDEILVDEGEPMLSLRDLRFTMVSRDYVLVGGIMFIYIIIAFTNLGNIESPQSIWDARHVQEEISPKTRKISPVIMDFGKVERITKMQVMLGPRENQKFNISISEDGQNWQGEQEFEAKSVFAWENFVLDLNTRYIKLEPVTDKLMINEMGFKNVDMVITPIDISEGNAALFDEQSLVPDKINYKNSTYFDEIYHPRTAYEFIHNMNVYETTHPPLGKVIMSWGIMIFGMTPFGWRFMGTLFGVLMIFVVYAFAKKIFNKTGIAFFTALIFTFDFMHFAQTRLATIDTYVTFFVLCMYYYMYGYYKENFYEMKLKENLKLLGLSGMFMGLAIASKWQGVYGALGLAVIFFYVLYQRYQEYIFARNNYGLNYIHEENIMGKFENYTKTTLISCGIFFVVIPLIIYAISYIPFLQTPGMDGIKSIISSQDYMFSYHSELVSEHPYASAWWTWPFDIRPIFYFVSDLGNGIKQGISSFGNPLVCWVGVVGIVYCIYKLFTDDKEIPLFLLIAFGSQFLPWALVSRTTYIYHYFPSVPFITLIIAYMFYDLLEHRRPNAKYIYAGLVVFIFIMFYPILSGMPISVKYVENFLRWLPSWQLI